MEQQTINAEKKDITIYDLQKNNNIKIERIGSWIWVSGDTFEIKDTLKEMGFFYSGNKKAWYFNGDSVKRPCRAYYKNLNELKQKFGYQELNPIEC